MKSCPICKSRCFDDMEICYGCMYRFDGGASSPLIPTGQAPEAAPDHSTKEAQMRARPFSEEEFIGEGLLFEPAPARCNPADHMQQGALEAVQPAPDTGEGPSEADFQAAIPVGMDLFKTGYQLVISLQPRSSTVSDPIAVSH